MSKNPKQFKSIKNNFDNWVEDTLSSFPDRKSKRYKTDIRKILSTYLNFTGRLTKKSISELAVRNNKKKNKLKGFLVNSMYDFNDLKKDYIKINHVSNTYSDQRKKSILNLTNNLSLVQTIYTAEFSNFSHYRFKISENIKNSLNIIESQYVTAYHEVCKYDSTLKLLKAVTKEIDYLLSII